MSSRQYAAPKGSVIVLPTGARAVRQLDNRVQTTRLTVTLRSAVTVASGPAGARRADGRLSNALRLVVTENGNDWYGPIRGRSARILAESQSGQSYPVTALPTGNLANGTYPLEETFDIFFAHPLSVNPVETSYMEFDPNSFLNLEAYTVNNVIDTLLDADTAVVTMAPIEMSVIQHADPARGTLPWFKGRAREQSQIVAGSISDFQFNIRTRQRLRGVLLSQEVQLASGGIVPVADAISAVRLIGDDGRNIIGPAQADWQMIVNGQAAVQGGVPDAGAYFQNFQRFGHLFSTIVPEREYPNLRWEADVAPSGTAGTTSLVETILELTRTPPDASGYATVAPPLELPVQLR